MKNIIIAIITLFLLISCTKNEKNYTVKETNGVKVYHNTTTPADPNFKIEPKELFTIQGYDENAKDSLRNFIFSQCIKVDSKNNIFIMDKKKSEIKKFDKKGKFVNSFGRKGSGPGEMEQPNTMVMQNDTLYICDEPRSQLVIFDNDGKFIRKSLIDNSLMFMEPVDSTKFISIYGDWKNEDDQWYLIYNLHLRDFKFKVLNSFRESVFKYIRDETYFFDHMPSFCVGKEYIYVAKISTDEYRIDVYDFNSNEKYRILKHFRRIPMSEEETQSVNKAWWCKHKPFKKAIDQISMYEDKNGYLLVKVPLERNDQNRFDYVVDAFKDGVFINRFKMDIGKAIDSFDNIHKKYFYSDRIYDQNCDDNCVTVYEY